MRHALSLVLALCFATSTLAAELAGVKLDEHATVGGKELVLNGAGLRTRAFFKIYVASLYLPAKVGDATAALEASPRRVQLNLLLNLSADQLVDALNDGLKENNSETELAAVKAQVEQLASIMKGFKEAREKEIVSLDYADGVTRVLLNGEARGSIPGEAFNRALMKVWLGEHPVQSSLKKAMLGG